MPPPRETGKDRWKRVPKDYFKKPDHLQRTKLRLTGLAAFAALAWWAVGVDWSGQQRSFSSLTDIRASHGTLNRVHATWDNKCEACHVPFEPITGRSLQVATSTPAGHSGDRLCMACHAGPEHHQASIAAEVKGCAECHRDHRGRDASLVRLPDGECTNCHANLAEHIAPADREEGRRKYGNMNRFDTDHPDFRPEAAEFAANKPPKDLSRLKFNHALHMAPGLTRADGEVPYTVEKIPIKAEQARYGKDPAAPVQLECASCHVLDASELQGGPNPTTYLPPLPSRNPGKYYLPVEFQSSCRACHALSFDPKLDTVEAPHGVQPDQVAAFVRQTYAAQLLGDDPKLLATPVSPNPLPGKLPVDAEVKQRFDDAVTNAEKTLFAGKTNCNECHYVDPAPSGIVPARVQATRVPEVWWTHAKFNHTSHQAVSCRDCHAQSYALDESGKRLANASTQGADYNLPGIENCRQCHAPASGGAAFFGVSTSAPVRGGASFDCTECHGYHNGDHPLQGSGATAQHATEIKSVAQFLDGVTGKPSPTAPVTSTATPTPSPRPTSVPGPATR